MAMIKRKFITHIAWTRWGLAKFTDEVNKHLRHGWEIVAIEMSHKPLRTLCSAVLMIPEHCACECSCCTGEAQHDSSCQCACDCCVVHSDQAPKATGTEPEPEA